MKSSAQPYKYENFAYFDTNILSFLAKELENQRFQSVWKIRAFLLENDLALAISEAHMLELSDADRIHESLATLLFILPSALIKSREVILKEEVKSHPNLRNQALMVFPINPLFLEEDSIDKLREVLFSKDNVKNARSKQRQQAQQMPEEHSKLKKNFPLSNQGKFIKEQAPEFSRLMALEALARLHRNFLAQFQQKVADLKLQNFQGAYIRGAAIFYKYYLGRREPVKESELGDFGHLYYVPYCKLIVMEKDLCNILLQIQRNQNILTETRIESIEFIRNLLQQ